MPKVVKSPASKRKAFQFSVLLIVISFLSVSLRMILEDPSSVPAGDSVWELHWEFEISEGVPESLVYLATPMDSRFVQVFEQNIAIQGVSLRRGQLTEDGTREIIAKIIQKNDISIAVNFAIHVSPLGIPHFVKKTRLLGAEQRLRYLVHTPALPVNDESVTTLLAEILGQIENPEKHFNVIFEFCASKVGLVEDSNQNAVTDIIATHKANALGKARLLTTLARAAKIPARVVTGMVLEEGSDVQPHYWVEIYTNGEWLSYDPGEGYVKELPYNYIAVQKNAESFLTLPENVQFQGSYFEISQRDATVGMFDNQEKIFIDILDLNRLSLSTRLTLAFLLLLPIGALFTVFIRQILGPNVYGTFTPTFLALAFVHVGWKTGGIILILITVIGVIGRSITPMLGLNRVSRLTMVFILVAITMIFSVSAMVYYGIAPDGSIVLLPIVILTYMIDRIYTLADSDGVKVAMIRLLWTLLVSVVVVKILQFDLLGLWLLNYPEAHLTTAALVILISQYKGKKWLEKTSVAWMLEPKPAKKTKESEGDM